MLASELKGYINEIMETHGDMEIRVPALGGDLPVEGVLAILIENGNEQYFLVADAETIDGIESEESKDSGLN